ncbi:MAG: leucine-rich repeat protein [Marinifilaceae bacterium]
MKSHLTSLTVIAIFLLLCSCSKENETEHEQPSINNFVKIAVTKLPNKLEYTIGEPLSLEGIEVQGTRKDNSTEILKVSEQNIKGFSTAQSNENLSITVAIDTLTTMFTIHILPIGVKDGTLTFVEPNITNLVLPHNIKSIGDAVFKKSKITSIQLNEGLESIGVMAFAWSEIKTINFPKSLTEIKQQAFYGCKNIDAIDLSNTALQKIANETFAFNENVTYIKLPQTIKSIEYQAFTHTQSLDELHLPEGLLTIGNEAFRACGIKSLRLPNSICYMDQRAFYLSEKLQRVETFGDVSSQSSEIEKWIMESSTFERCPELIYFEIPKGISIIGWNTISGSPQLTSITIPSTVKQINFNAFGNTALQSVTLEGIIPPTAETKSGAWQAFPYNIQTIKVPNGYTNTYKEAIGWANYADKIIN